MVNPKSMTKVEGVGGGAGEEGRGTHTVPRVTEWVEKENGRTINGDERETQTDKGTVRKRTRTRKKFLGEGSECGGIVVHWSVLLWRQVRERVARRRL